MNLSKQVETSRVDPLPLASESGPITESSRLLSIDVARGIALLGIFFVNAVLFGEPLADTIQPHLPVDEGWLGVAAYWFTSIFCNGKFYPMFSTLFGVGLAIMYQSAQASGRSFGWVFFRRLLVLGAFGVLHIVLLWNGDVLLIYAGIGMLMLALGRASAKTLARVGFIVFGLGVVLLAGVVTLMVLFDKPRPENPVIRPMPEAATRVEQISAIMKDWNTEEMYDSRLKAVEQDVMVNGPFAAAVMLRLMHYSFFVPFIFIFMFWVIFPCFCWGAALLRAGFFHGQHREWRRRFVILGLFVGLPLNVLAAYGTTRQHEPFWMFAAGLGFNIGGPMMTFMYLSWILDWVDSGRARKLAEAFSRVGRMALTAYLLESLLMSAVMVHWGLGFFGSTTWAQRVVWLVGIYCVIAIFCNLWIRVFRMGPMEWLWRTLTYLRWQRLVR